MHDFLRKLAHLDSVAPEPIVPAYQTMHIAEKYIELASPTERRILNFFCTFEVVRVSLISKYQVPLRTISVYMMKDYFKK